MNQKQWIIIGIIITVLLVVGYIFFQDNDSGGTAEIGAGSSVLEIAYCTDEQVKPCIVSFGIDIDGNMLVNILMPVNFPGFYLEVMRGETLVSYACRRVTATPNNAYCIGEKLPPGETLHLMLIAISNDELLAQVDLSIIGLAFPTLEIAFPTAPPAETSVPTETVASATPTPIQIQLPTKTQPAFSTPSYP